MKLTNCSNELYKERPLIVIAGPTAVGKSKAAVRLAKEIGGEVVSADSMQVYRGMDIGSAKVTAEEMDGIPHHLIDVIEPKETYNVTRFQSMAKEAISGIYERGHIPILCGGTGFYIQALIYDIDFTKEPDEALSAAYRKELETEAQALGAQHLHERLRKIDPEAAEAIPQNNVKRVIRAIEFYKIHGEPISVHNRREQEKRKTPAYKLSFFVLSDDRKALYERIDRRVDVMMEQGLLEEVRRLKEAGVPRSSTAMQGIGYRELYAYLSGEGNLEDAIRLIKQNSRHYAKRQLTWFKREQKAVWIDIQGKEEIESEFRRELQKQHLWRAGDQ